MQVYVKNSAGNTICLQVDGASATIAHVKAQVALQLQLDEDEFWLSAESGAQLERDCDESCCEVTLNQLGITPESTLYVNLALLGAGKKRKKKKYTKPKKLKHKKKKVKLAVLKYYKVDANDQIVRLRPECPNASCGAGVFMAKHHNRTYCGRCTMTYVIKAE